MRFIVIFSFIAISFQTFSQSDTNFSVIKSLDVDAFVLNDGYTLELEKDTQNLVESKTTATRGSYDGSRYRIKINKGVFSIDYVESKKGVHSSEFKAMNAKGSGAYKNDTLFLNLESVGEHFYLFSIEKNSEVDSFSKELEVTIAAKDLNGNNASFWYNQFSKLDVVVMPPNVARDKIFKRKHKVKHVAEFTYFRIKGDNGVTKYYPAGDYVLVGANSFRAN